MGNAIVRPAVSSDEEAFAQIYNGYIRESTITFEVEPVAGSEFERRMAKALLWFALEVEGEVCGYAYATPYHPRAAYRHTVEISIYIEASVCGKGYGRRLYEALFKAMESRNIHVAIAGIALPNAESVALHEGFGMEKVAHFKEVGRKFGRWIDVGHWQTFIVRSGVAPKGEFPTDEISRSRAQPLGFEASP